MKPFIRATEIWLPTQDHTLLEYGGGLFGPALDFAATSSGMCFGRAEGLPGQAWDVGHPVLLKQFEAAQFQRTAAAKLAGLTCAVAIPFFLDDQLTAVLVFFGGEDDASAGAIELWRNDPRITSDMTLADGYYGGTPEGFEALSRETFLPRGTGLPGLAWQRQEAVVMADLGPQTRFLRGDAASDAGIERGLALPCCSQTHAAYVLTLLSGKEAPIARRIERWVPDASRQSLSLAGGYDEQGQALVPGSATLALSATVADHHIPLQQAFLSGAPALHAGQASGTDRGHDVVAVPVIADGQVTEVVSLSF